ncbi:sialate O-acetylesterase [uncultured Polaribacter sp.]|uniref:DUF7151 family protein n=1 Tax=uncultured Polaribacter sp. TaxID=174711 RepID=UPI00260AF992|nr:sialate O-acetylesterase [uncultured Polaribacter sp.]
MKKIAFLLLLLINLSCEKEVLVEQEIKVSLINITPETSGNCSNGGYKIETGIDTNNNGLLETNEVQSTNFICNGTNGNDGNNGIDGSNSLINISSEPAGTNCENGGYKIETGTDSNNNEILESNEVQSTNFICNGTNGNDGLSSLINISEEPKGDNCENGGYKIETGIDTNNNGILDSNEIETIKYICIQKIIIPTNYNIETKYNVEGILTYGQSLAVDNGASNSNSDFKNTLSFIGGNSVVNSIDLSSFIKVKEATNISYAPVMASTLVALNLIEEENNLDIEEYGYQYLSLTGGVSGAPVSSMKKGTSAYQNVIEAITSAKALSNQQGKTFAWRVINWVQGESNRFNTKEQYYNQVEQLFYDFNTDIKKITGQKEDIKFIIHQTSPWIGRDLGGTTPHPHNNVQEAQLQLANDKTNVYMDGGSYQFKYNDFFHPSDRAVIGLKQGVFLKRIINDNKEWRTFQPISHSIVSYGNKYHIHLKFDVPVKPMRFDVSGDIWHNPNGKQPNFGFEVLDNGIEKQVKEPYITLGNTVVLTTEKNPEGMTIRYAVNGHKGGGNLCDSQNIIVENKGVDYVIDNFAVSFSEYIID